MRRIVPTVCGAQYAISTGTDTTVKVWLLLLAFTFTISVVHVAFFPDRDSLLVLLVPQCTWPSSAGGTLASGGLRSVTG